MSINYQRLKGDSKDNEARLFSVMPDDKTRGHEQNLEPGLPLNIRKHFCAVWVMQH